MVSLKQQPAAPHQPPRTAEDSGPGVHDTTVAACSHELYEGILGIGVRLL